MQDVQLRNGLACKISVRTFQMVYLENSEDFMYRPRKRASAGRRSASPASRPAKRSLGNCAFLRKWQAGNVSDAQAEAFTELVAARDPTAVFPHDMELAEHGEHEEDEDEEDEEAAAEMDGATALSALEGVAAVAVKAAEYEGKVHAGPAMDLEE